MLRPLLSLLMTAGVAYVGLCAFLFFAQRSMIYYPQPRALGGNSTLIALPVDDARVQVSTRPRSGPNAVIYFGGNAEDVSYTLSDLAVAFPEHALYLLHYRGYGGSSGAPSEAALQADALVLFDTVYASHPQVVAVGRSLGSGIAVQLASQRPVARLVLVTPYDSLVELAAHHYPWFPVRWLLRDKYESWRYAARVTAPTLLLAAEHDEVIPRARSEALHAHFRPGIASMRVVTGTGHNTIHGSAEYLSLLTGKSR